MVKIGSGGTHDIFINTDDDKFVVKIDRDLLSRVAQRTEVTPEMIQTAHTITQEKENEYKALQDSFGREHCLCEKYFVDKVYTFEQNRPIDTIITIQEKSDAFTNPANIDFSASYLDEEAQSIDESDYAKLLAIAEGKGFDEELFLKYETKSRPIFEKIDTDGLFAKCISDFIEKFRKYYDKNQQILDFVGEKNVLFFSQNETWKFQIGSVLKGNAKATQFRESLTVLENSPERFDESPDKEGIVYNTLANARIINATAYKLKRAPVFNFTLSEKTRKNLRFPAQK